MTTMPHKCEIVSSGIVGTELLVRAVVDGVSVQERFDAASVLKTEDGSQKTIEYISEKYCTCGSPLEFQFPIGLKVEKPWAALTFYERLKHALSILVGQ